MKNKIEVECTWGMADDISIDLNGIVYLLKEPATNRHKHGICFNGGFGLTKDEAKELIFKLNKAIKICNNLENGLNILEEE